MLGNELGAVVGIPNTTTCMSTNELKGIRFYPTPFQYASYYSLNTNRCSQPVINKPSTTSGHGRDLGRCCSGTFIPHSAKSDAHARSHLPSPSPSGRPCS